MFRWLFSRVVLGIVLVLGHGAASSGVFAMPGSQAVCHVLSL